MCVGVSTSSMPSLAKFVRHYFPNVSIIDSLGSLKAFLFTVRRSDSSSVTPSVSSSRNQIIPKADYSELPIKTKQSADVFDAHNVELGNMSQITTLVEGRGVFEVDHLDGIQVHRSWEHTTQRERSTKSNNL